MTENTNEKTKSHSDIKNNSLVTTTWNMYEIDLSNVSISRRSKNEKTETAKKSESSEESVKEIHLNVEFKIRNGLKPTDRKQNSQREERLRSKSTSDISSKENKIDFMKLEHRKSTEKTILSKSYSTKIVSESTDSITRFSIENRGCSKRSFGDNLDKSTNRSIEKEHSSKRSISKNVSVFRTRSMDSDPRFSEAISGSSKLPPRDFVDKSNRSNEKNVFSESSISKKIRVSRTGSTDSDPGLKPGFRKPVFGDSVDELNRSTKKKQNSESSTTKKVLVSRTGSIDSDPKLSTKIVGSNKRSVGDSVDKSNRNIEERQPIGSYSNKISVSRSRCSYSRLSTSISGSSRRSFGDSIDILNKTTGSSCNKKVSDSRTGSIDSNPRRPTESSGSSKRLVGDSVSDRSIDKKYSSGYSSKKNYSDSRTGYTDSDCRLPHKTPGSRERSIGDSIDKSNKITGEINSSESSNSKKVSISKTRSTYSDSRVSTKYLGSSKRSFDDSVDKSNKATKEIYSSESSNSKKVSDSRTGSDCRLPTEILGPSKRPVDDSVDKSNKATKKIDSSESSSSKKVSDSRTGSDCRLPTEILGPSKRPVDDSVDKSNKSTKEIDSSESSSSKEVSDYRTESDCRLPTKILGSSKRPVDDSVDKSNKSTKKINSSESSSSKKVSDSRTGSDCRLPTKILGPRKHPVDDSADKSNKTTKKINSSESSSSKKVSDSRIGSDCRLPTEILGSSKRPVDDSVDKSNKSTKKINSSESSSSKKVSDSRTRSDCRLPTEILGPRKHPVDDSVDKSNKTTKRINSSESSSSKKVSDSRTRSDCRLPTEILGSRKRLVDDSVDKSIKASKEINSSESSSSKKISNSRTRSDCRLPTEILGSRNHPVDDSVDKSNKTTKKINSSESSSSKKVSDSRTGSDCRLPTEILGSRKRPVDDSVDKSIKASKEINSSESSSSKKVSVSRTESDCRLSTEILRSSKRPVDDSVDKSNEATKKINSSESSSSKKVSVSKTGSIGLNSGLSTSNAGSTHRSFGDSVDKSNKATEKSDSSRSSSIKKVSISKTRSTYSDSRVSTKYLGSSKRSFDDSLDKSNKITEKVNVSENCSSKKVSVSRNVSTHSSCRLSTETSGSSKDLVGDSVDKSNRSTKEKRLSRNFSSNNVSVSTAESATSDTAETSASSKHLSDDSVDKCTKKKRRNKSKISIARKQRLLDLFGDYIEEVPPTKKRHLSSPISKSKSKPEKVTVKRKSDSSVDRSETKLRKTSIDVATVTQSEMEEYSPTFSVETSEVVTFETSVTNSIGVNIVETKLKEIFEEPPPKDETTSTLSGGKSGTKAEKVTTNHKNDSNVDRSETEIRKTSIDVATVTQSEMEEFPRTFPDETPQVVASETSITNGKDLNIIEAQLKKLFEESLAKHETTSNFSGSKSKTKAEKVTTKRKSDSSVDRSETKIRKTVTQVEMEEYPRTFPDESSEVVTSETSVTNSIGVNIVETKFKEIFEKPPPKDETTSTLSGGKSGTKAEKVVTNHENDSNVDRSESRIRKSSIDVATVTQSEMEEFPRTFPDEASQVVASETSITNEIGLNIVKAKLKESFEEPLPKDEEVTTKLDSDSSVDTSESKIRETSIDIATITHVEIEEYPRTFPDETTSITNGNDLNIVQTKLKEIFEDPLSTNETTSETPVMVRETQTFEEPPVRYETTSETSAMVEETQNFEESTVRDEATNESSVDVEEPLTTVLVRDLTKSLIVVNPQIIENTFTFGEILAPDTNDSPVKIERWIIDDTVIEVNVSKGNETSADDQISTGIEFQEIKTEPIDFTDSIENETPEVLLELIKVEETIIENAEIKEEFTNSEVSSLVPEDMPLLTDEILEALLPENFPVSKTNSDSRSLNVNSSSIHTSAIETSMTTTPVLSRNNGESFSKSSHSQILPSIVPSVSEALQYFQTKKLSEVTSLTSLQQLPVTNSSSIAAFVTSTVSSSFGFTVLKPDGIVSTAAEASQNQFKTVSPLSHLLSSLGETTINQVSSNQSTKTTSSRLSPSLNQQDSQSPESSHVAIQSSNQQSSQTATSCEQPNYNSFSSQVNTPVQSPNQQSSQTATSYEQPNHNRFLNQVNMIVQSPNQFSLPMPVPCRQQHSRSPNLRTSQIVAPPMPPRYYSNVILQSSKQQLAPPMLPNYYRNSSIRLPHNSSVAHQLSNQQSSQIVAPPMLPNYRNSSIRLPHYSSVSTQSSNQQHLPVVRPPVGPVWSQSSTRLPHYSTVTPQSSSQHSNYVRSSNLISKTCNVMLQSICSYLQYEQLKSSRNVEQVEMHLQSSQNVQPSNKQLQRFDNVSQMGPSGVQLTKKTDSLKQLQQLPRNPLQPIDNHQMTGPEKTPFQFARPQSPKKATRVQSSNKVQRTYPNQSDVGVQSSLYSSPNQPRVRVVEKSSLINQPVSSAQFLNSSCPRIGDISPDRLFDRSRQYRHVSNEECGEIIASHLEDFYHWKQLNGYYLEQIQTKLNYSESATLTFDAHIKSSLLEHGKYLLVTLNLIYIEQFDFQEILNVIKMKLTILKIQHIEIFIFLALFTLLQRFQALCNTQFSRKMFTIISNQAECIIKRGMITNQQIKILRDQITSFRLLKGRWQTQIARYFNELQKKHSEAVPQTTGSKSLQDNITNNKELRTKGRKYEKKSRNDTTVSSRASESGSTRTPPPKSTSTPPVVAEPSAIDSNETITRIETTKESSPTPKCRQQNSESFPPISVTPLSSLRDPVVSPKVTVPTTQQFNEVPTQEVPTSRVNSGEKTRSDLAKVVDSIDLTWLDEIDPEVIGKEIDSFPVKLEPNEKSLQRDIVSPVDSGLGSPQVEFEAAWDANCLCHCGKEAMFICRCSGVTYCCITCQMNDWKDHGPQCTSVLPDNFQNS